MADGEGKKPTLKELQKEKKDLLRDLGRLMTREVDDKQRDSAIEVVEQLLAYAEAEGEGVFPADDIRPLTKKLLEIRYKDDDAAAPVQALVQKVVRAAANVRGKDEDEALDTVFKVLDYDLKMYELRGPLPGLEESGLEPWRDELKAGEPVELYHFASANWVRAKITEISDTRGLHVYILGMKGVMSDTWLPRDAPALVPAGTHLPIETDAFLESQSWRKELSEGTEVDAFDSNRNSWRWAKVVKTSCAKEPPMDKDETTTTSNPLVSAGASAGGGGGSAEGGKEDEGGSGEGEGKKEDGGEGEEEDGDGILRWVKLETDSGTTIETWTSVESPRIAEKGSRLDPPRSFGVGANPSGVSSSTIPRIVSPARIPVPATESTPLSLPPAKFSGTIASTVMDDAAANAVLDDLEAIGAADLDWDNIVRYRPPSRRCGGLWLPENVRAFLGTGILTTFVQRVRKAAIRLHGVASLGEDGAADGGGERPAPVPKDAPSGPSVQCFFELFRIITNNHYLFHRDWLRRMAPALWALFLKLFASLTDAQCRVTRIETLQQIGVAIRCLQAPIAPPSDILEAAERTSLRIAALAYHTGFLNLRVLGIKLFGEAATAVRAKNAAAVDVGMLWDAVAKAKVLEIALDRREGHEELFQRVPDILRTFLRADRMPEATLDLLWNYGLGGGASEHQRKLTWGVLTELAGDMGARQLLVVLARIARFRRSDFTEPAIALTERIAQCEDHTERVGPVCLRLLWRLVTDGREPVLDGIPPVEKETELWEAARKAESEGKLTFVDPDGTITPVSIEAAAELDSRPVPEDQLLPESASGDPPTSEVSSRAMSVLSKLLELHALRHMRLAYGIRALRALKAGVNATRMSELVRSMIETFCILPDIPGVGLSKAEAASRLEREVGLIETFLEDAKRYKERAKAKAATLEPPATVATLEVEEGVVYPDAIRSRLVALANVCEYGDLRLTLDQTVELWREHGGNPLCQEESNAWYTAVVDTVAEIGGGRLFAVEDEQAVLEACVAKAPREELARLTETGLAAVRALFFKVNTNKGALVRDYSKPLTDRTSVKLAAPPSELVGSDCLRRISVEAERSAVAVGAVRTLLSLFDHVADDVKDADAFRRAFVEETLEAARIEMAAGPSRAAAAARALDNLDALVAFGDQRGFGDLRPHASPALGPRIAVRVQHSISDKHIPATVMIAYQEKGKKRVPSRIVIRLHAEAPLWELRAGFAAKLGVDATRVRLAFGGKTLGDEDSGKTLAEANIRDGVTVNASYAPAPRKWRFPLAQDDKAELRNARLTAPAERALMLVFSRFCNEDGLMSKSDIRSYFRACGITDARNLGDERLRQIFSGVNTTPDGAMTPYGFSQFYAHAALQRVEKAYDDFVTHGFDLTTMQPLKDAVIRTRDHPDGVPKEDAEGSGEGDGKKDGDKPLVGPGSAARIIAQEEEPVEAIPLPESPRWGKGNPRAVLANSPEAYKLLFLAASGEAIEGTDGAGAEVQAAVQTVSAAAWRILMRLPSAPELRPLFRVQSALPTSIAEDGEEEGSGDGAAGSASDTKASSDGDESEVEAAGTVTPPTEVDWAPILGSDSVRWLYALRVFESLAMPLTSARKLAPGIAATMDDPESAEGASSSGSGDNGSGSGGGSSTPPGGIGPMNRPGADNGGMVAGPATADGIGPSGGDEPPAGADSGGTGGVGGPEGGSGTEETKEEDEATKKLREEAEKKKAKEEARLRADRAARAAWRRSMLVAPKGKTEAGVKILLQILDSSKTSAPKEHTFLCLATALKLVRVLLVSCAAVASPHADAVIDTCGIPEPSESDEPTTPPLPDSGAGGGAAGGAAPSSTTPSTSSKSSKPPVTSDEVKLAVRAIMDSGELEEGGIGNQTLTSLDIAALYRGIADVLRLVQKARVEDEGAVAVTEHAMGVLQMLAAHSPSSYAASLEDKDVRAAEDIPRILLHPNLRTRRLVTAGIFNITRACDKFIRDTSTTLTPNPREFFQSALLDRLDEVADSAAAAAAAAARGTASSSKDSSSASIPCLHFFNLLNRLLRDSCGVPQPWEENKSAGKKEKKEGEDGAPEGGGDGAGKEEDEKAEEDKTPALDPEATAELERRLEPVVSGLMRRLVSHPPLETRIGKDEDRDQLLSGILSTLATLARALPSVRLRAGVAGSGDVENRGPKDTLVRVVFEDCLFFNPSSPEDIDESSGPRLPKCKRSKTREAAFNLLSALCEDNPSNVAALGSALAPVLSGVSRVGGFRYSADDEAKSPTGYVGLVNLGCICYMNAMLQQLFMIPHFRFGILDVVPDVDDDDLDEYELEELKRKKAQGGGEGEGDESAVAKKKKKKMAGESNAEGGGAAESKPKASKSILYQLQRMFSSLLMSERKAYNPRPWTNSFPDSSGRPVNVSKQEDAEEFFNRILSFVDDSLKGTRQSRLLRETLGGTQADQLACPDVDWATERRSEFNHLQLPIERKTVEEILVCKKKADVVEGFRCSAAPDIPTTLHKRQVLLHTPEVFVLHLQRIAFSFETLQNEKNNAMVSFPMELDVSPFTRAGIRKAELEGAARARRQRVVDGSCDDADLNPFLKVYGEDADEILEVATQIGDLEKAGEEIPEELEARIRDIVDREKVRVEDTMYRLAGVVCQTGGANSGHYYSFIRDRATNLWFKFNDSWVSEFDPKDIPKECFGGEREVTRTTEWGYEVKETVGQPNNAYVLFYERIGDSKIDVAASLSGAVLGAGAASFRPTLVTPTSRPFDQAAIEELATAAVERIEDEDERDRKRREFLEADAAGARASEEYVSRLQSLIRGVLDEETDTHLSRYQVLERLLPEKQFRRAFRDNLTFLRNRDVFSSEFFTFVRDLFTRSAATLEEAAETLDAEHRKDGATLTAMSSTESEITPVSSDGTMTEAGLRQLLRNGAQFVMNVIAHSKHDSAVPGLCGALGRVFAKSSIASHDLISMLMEDTTHLAALMLQCPSTKTRSSLRDLMAAAFQCIIKLPEHEAAFFPREQEGFEAAVAEIRTAEEEKRAARAAAKEDAGEVEEKKEEEEEGGEEAEGGEGSGSSSGDSGGKKRLSTEERHAREAEGRARKASLVVRFVDALLDMLPMVDEHWPRMSQYWGVLADFAGASPNFRRYLVHRGMLDKMVDFYLAGGGSSPKDLEQRVRKDRRKIAIMGNTAVSVQWGTFLDLLAQLVCSIRVDPWARVGISVRREVATRCRGPGGPGAKVFSWDSDPPTTLPGAFRYPLKDDGSPGEMPDVALLEAEKAVEKREEVPVVQSFWLLHDPTMLMRAAKAGQNMSAVSRITLHLAWEDISFSDSIADHLCGASCLAGMAWRNASGVTKLLGDLITLPDSLTLRRTHVIIGDPYSGTWRENVALGYPYRPRPAIVYSDYLGAYEKEDREAMRERRLRNRAACEERVKTAQETFDKLKEDGVAADASEEDRATYEVTVASAEADLNEAKEALEKSKLPDEFDEEDVGATSLQNWKDPEERVLPPEEDAVDPFEGSGREALTLRVSRTLYTVRINGGLLGRVLRNLQSSRADHKLQGVELLALIVTWAGENDVVRKYLWKDIPPMRPSREDCFGDWILRMLRFGAHFATSSSGLNSASQAVLCSAYEFLASKYDEWDAEFGIERVKKPKRLTGKELEIDLARARGKALLHSGQRDMWVTVMEYVPPGEEVKHFTVRAVSTYWDPVKFELKFDTREKGAEPINFPIPDSEDQPIYTPCDRWGDILFPWDVPPLDPSKSAWGGYYYNWRYHFVPHSVKAEFAPDPIEVDLYVTLGIPPLGSKASSSSGDGDGGGEGGGAPSSSHSDPGMARVAGPPHLDVHSGAIVPVDYDEDILAGTDHTGVVDFINPGRWKCGNCGQVVDAREIKCKQCGGMKGEVGLSME